MKLFGFCLARSQSTSNALGEEPKHVVPDGVYWLSGFHPCFARYVLQEWSYMLQASLRFCRRHMQGELSAAEVVALLSRQVKDKAAVGYQFPPLLHG